MAGAVGAPHVVGKARARSLGGGLAEAITRREGVIRTKIIGRGHIFRLRGVVGLDHFTEVREHLGCRHVIGFGGGIRFLCGKD